jgi:acetyl esterase/lipase
MFFSALASAQTPTPTPTPSPDGPYPLPGPETLNSAYQPSAYSHDPPDGTVLQRVRFVPDPQKYGPGPYPVAITIHPGNFYLYDEYGVPSENWANQQLVNAGFLVFSIDYRLAPNLDGSDGIGEGLIIGQAAHDGSPQGVASGRPPEQFDDVEQQILAAYYDSQSNHKIFLVGGSAGATHALWAALNRTSGLPPGWPLPVGAIRAVASLSGPCDLSSWVGDDPDKLLLFEAKITNYTNTITNTGVDHTLQYSASPVSLVATATNIPPIRLFYTLGDPVPHQQSEEMFNALFARFADVMKYKVNDSDLHAFNYWRTINEQTGQTVGKDVVDFFNLHLN